MNKQDSLPPLPPSDPGAIERNSYDSNYDVRAREFWKGNQIIREEEKPFKKCNHEFKMVVNGVKCVKCHFGLMGPLEVKNGKLFHKGEKLPL